MLSVTIIFTLERTAFLGTTYAVSILIIDIMIFLKIYVIKVTLNRQSELSAMYGFAQV